MSIPPHTSANTPQTTPSSRIPDSARPFTIPPGTRPTRPKRYALVIFDMDGTLTEERLDFDTIRSELGVPDGMGILEFIGRQEGDAATRANTILHRHELAAAQSCIVHNGAHDVLAALKAQGIRTALLTRNSAPCTTHILARHKLTLDHVATREDRPHKPHRDSIMNLVRKFAIPREQTLMVGDYLYDLQAARRARVRSVLIQHRDEPLPEFAPLATYTVRSLHDVLTLATGGMPAGAQAHRFPQEELPT